MLIIMLFCLNSIHTKPYVAVSKVMIGMFYMYGSGGVERNIKVGLCNIKFSGMNLLVCLTLPP